MKKSILLLVAVISTALAFAQAPNKISYQSVIRDASGALAANQAIAVRVSILESSATGISSYSETHTLTTNDNGLASFEIGTGSVINGSMSSVNWGNDTYYLRTETDPNGGNNYSIIGTQQLLSVPYAMHAKTADAITGGAQSNWNLSGGNIYSSNSGNVGIGTTNANQKLTVNGSSQLSGGYVSLALSPDNSLGNVGIGSNGSSNVKLRVESDQDYGILLEALNVTGYGLYVNGNAAKPGGSTWTVASDANLKKDVVTYTDGLHTLMSIRPVKFKYTKESGFNDQIEYVGVLAQDLQKVAPYMVESFVNEYDKEEYLAVDNHAMTYMLINAVQEQQETIEDLQKQLNEMKTMMEEIKASSNK